MISMRVRRAVLVLHLGEHLLGLRVHLLLRFGFLLLLLVQILLVVALALPTQGFIYNIITRTCNVRKQSLIALVFSSFFEVFFFFVATFFAFFVFDEAFFVPFVFLLPELDPELDELSSAKHWIMFSTSSRFEASSVQSTTTRYCTKSCMQGHDHE